MLEVDAPMSQRLREVLAGASLVAAQGPAWAQAAEADPVHLHVGPQDAAAAALARSAIWALGRSQARVHRRGSWGRHSKRVASQSPDSLGT